MLAQNIPASTRSQLWKRLAMSESLAGPLDRVNVLSGHTGCVNALSWAKDGELLLSGGDDTTVRMWRVDPRDAETTYPLVCQSVIRTGHQANIFNAQMLPFSSRIATVAGDKQVRVFDIGDGTTGISGGQDAGTHYDVEDHCLRVLKCHHDRVKRIVTEESPDLFLTISEDGTARQHDLRVPHQCMSGECPAPLVKLPAELMSISLSPLTPYQFVVGGESPYGYLFDRRHIGRYIEQEWGISPDVNQATTCVRRFGRRKKPGRREHITGVRMSQANGHEVLLSYSGDAVYLYSTTDDPGTAHSPKASPMPQNDKQMGEEDSSARTARLESNSPPPATELEEASDEGYVEEDGDGDEDEESRPDEAYTDEEILGSVPVVYPRSRFAGACNVRTVKDVNFLGPDDEFVVSGSDDGLWFIWRKASGKLHDILEGDGSVVNVIEGHPHLPLVAVSGIDHTVKLFAPVQGQSAFSRSQEADAIIKRNTAASRRSPVHGNIARLLLHFGPLVASTGDEEQCINQ